MSSGAEDVDPHIPDRDSREFRDTALIESKCVTLIVGKEQRRLAVHYEIICRQSDAFRHAFTNRSFIEARKDEMVLEAEEYDIVAMVMRWLYFGDLIEDKLPMSIYELAEVWNFADRWIMPILRDYAASASIQNMSWTGSSLKRDWARADLTKALNCLPSFSKLLVFMIQYCLLFDRVPLQNADAVEQESMDKAMDTLHMSLCPMRGNNRPESVLQNWFSDLIRCYYHNHKLEDGWDFCQDLDFDETESIEEN